MINTGNFYAVEDIDMHPSEIEESTDMNSSRSSNILNGTKANSTNGWSIKNLGICGRYGQNVEDVINTKTSNGYTAKQQVQANTDYENVGSASTSKAMVEVDYTRYSDEYFYDYK